MCGFEAFINGKHIVGKVKEKEQARKEYKEAISKGHGAYLMEEQEEQPVSSNSFRFLVFYLPPCLFELSYCYILFVKAY